MLLLHNFGELGVPRQSPLCFLCILASDAEVVEGGFEGANLRNDLAADLSHRRVLKDEGWTEIDLEFLRDGVLQLHARKGVHSCFQERLLQAYLLAQNGGDNVLENSTSIFRRLQIARLRAVGSWSDHNLRTHVSSNFRYCGVFEDERRGDLNLEVPRYSIL